MSEKLDEVKARMQRLAIEAMTSRLKAHMGERITVLMIEEIAEDMHEFVSEFLDNSVEDEEE